MRNVGWMFGVPSSRDNDGNYSAFLDSFPIKKISLFIFTQLYDEATSAEHVPTYTNTYCYTSPLQVGLDLVILFLGFPS